MEIKEYNLEVKENIQLTPDVHHIVCKVLEDDFVFESGQFLNIKIPDTEKTIFRAYSIASSNLDLKKIEFCIKVVENGKGSNYLAQTKKGDSLSIKGPFGHFILSENLDKNKLFVATGTGVATIRSMIERYLADGGQAKIHLLFGVRSNKDLFFVNEYKELENKYKNFRFDLAVSRLENEEDRVSPGRVTNFIQEKIVGSDLSETEVYMCGSKQMITDVKEICIEKGFMKENIFNESFY
jgi:ferredoxin-NADP reductase